MLVLSVLKGENRIVEKRIGSSRNPCSALSQWRWLGHDKEGLVIVALSKCAIATVQHHRHEGESGGQGSYQAHMILSSLIRESRHSFNIGRWECTLLQGRSTLGSTLLIERRAVGKGKGTPPGKRDNVQDGLVTAEGASKGTSTPLNLLAPKEVELW